jgi:hypothetical protein
MIYFGFHFLRSACLCCLLLVGWISTPGQAQWVKPLYFQSELGRFGATAGVIPFWLRANQYGIVPRQGPQFTIRQRLAMDYRREVRPGSDSLGVYTRNVDWGWGVEAVLNMDRTLRLLMPQVYLKIRLGPALEVWGGRRREIIGLVDSTLSSGSFAWSGNGLPMTKIQLAVPDYMPQGALFGIKGFYAHGWFESGRLFDHMWLHQKALYGRFGKPHWRLKLYAGMNHQVMWGGYTQQPLGTVITQAQLPNQWSDYRKVITAQTLANQTGIDTSRVSRFDRENRIGNHLGTVDVGVEYTARQLSVFAYRQSIYEDGSLFYLTNIRDGLNGLRIRNRRPLNEHGFQLESVLAEYLFTQNQGGALFLNSAAQRGRDNYFNHSQYQDGWSRYGMTLGTPFISPSTDSRSGLPAYGFTNNNRVSVWHLGLSGQAYNRVWFQLKASLSRNLGTYEVPFVRPVEQFSSLVSVSVPMGFHRRTVATAALGVDRGDLYERSVGFYAGIRYQGKSRKPPVRVPSRAKSPGKASG